MSHSTLRDRDNLGTVGLCRLEVHCLTGGIAVTSKMMGQMTRHSSEVENTDVEQIRRTSSIDKRFSSALGIPRETCKEIWWRKWGRRDYQLRL